jgi:hypothetical protein
MFSAIFQGVASPEEKLGMCLSFLYFGLVSILELSMYLRVSKWDGEYLRNQISFCPEKREKGDVMWDLEARNDSF